MDHATTLLQVRELSATFGRHAAAAPVVKGISFDIAAGEAVGFVGESGCGKSVTARALMRLAPEGSSVRWSGQVLFRGQDLLKLSPAAMQDVRGRRIAMVFQDPMSSLNPVLTVGAQIDDIIRRHMGLSAAAARQRTVELLGLVGIREPEQRANDYPHQFSGGMRQRVLIAIAVSCKPDLLIADEPTTALDVTVQAQILRLLMRLRRELGMALMLITHDFGVIAGMVERVYVMLDGSIVETGSTDAVFANPQHPYTIGLMGAIPSVGDEVERLTQIDGAMPRLTAIPSGCAFNPRCTRVNDVPDGRCMRERPGLLPAGKTDAACWLHDLRIKTPSPSQGEGRDGGLRARTRLRQGERIAQQRRHRAVTGDGGAVDLDE